MILHIFPKEIFAKEYVDFINKNFESEEHIFALYFNGVNKCEEGIWEYHNVYDVDREGMVWLLRNLRLSELNIFHCGGVSLKILLLQWLQPSIVRKSCWYIWGGDLYLNNGERKGIIDNIIFRIQKSVYKKYGLAGYIVEGDYKIAKEKYGLKCEGLPAMYFEESTQKIIFDLRETITSFECKNILIGNSATKSNHHVEAIDYISHFSDENIKVIVPLSYGNQEYAEQIIKYGREKLGDKFCPIREYLNKDDYYKLISTIDIGLFNNDRQQATANIDALLILGKKVYMKQGTSMWDSYSKRFGFHIHNINLIPTTSFADFCSNRDAEFNQNVSNIMLNEARFVDEWSKIFHYRLK